MAIQNFLSGGFYGSIGGLTGRRWKNKRIVQAKFKPANPKTPAQEAQRRLFTRGSALAKIAQQVNWRAPQFESPIRTDWNQRQTVAINALKNGATEWEALPLAPENFKAQHIIGGISLESISEAKEAKFVLQGTDLLENKKYACAIFIQTGEKAGQIIVGSGEADAGSAENITVRLPEADGIIGEECYIKMASYDDTTTDTVTLSAGIYLQQKTEAPYAFNPQLLSVELDSAYTLRVVVKLGQEEIESYDPFKNTVIRLYGSAWTKETAVDNDTLNTDNDSPIEQELTITRTTVAKTTATVTFACANTNLYLYEKFATKLDITINAANVKGVNSLPNSQTLTLTAQATPEYLQEICSITNPENLQMQANLNVAINGEWVCTGEIFAENDTSDTAKLLFYTKTAEEEENDFSEVTSVTLRNGQTYTGGALENLFDEYGPIIKLNGTQIGFGIGDQEIKTFAGTWIMSAYDRKLKLAFKGYRIFEIPKDASGFGNMYLTASN